MGEKTARDIMVQLEHYPHARPSQTLAEAADQLVTLQISVLGTTSMARVLLVLDDDNQLLGSVRRRDILHSLEPAIHDELDTAHPEAHVQPEIDSNLTDLIPALDPETLRKKLDRPIVEVVHELRAHVDVDDSLLKIVRELVGKDTHIAAVYEADTVVGVVRTLDVLRAIREIMAE
jgi:predicted transcriptional regulator